MCVPTGFVRFGRRYTPSAGACRSGNFVLSSQIMLLPYIDASYIILGFIAKLCFFHCRYEAHRSLRCFQLTASCGFWAASLPLLVRLRLRFTHNLPILLSGSFTGRLGFMRVSIGSLTLFLPQRGLLSLCIPQVPHVWLLTSNQN